MKCKLTIESCYKIADKMNGKCLSTKYRGTKFKYKWQCDNGHAWLATLDSVKNKNSWCPKCGFKKLSTLKRDNNGLRIAKKCAQNENGICLSKSYVNMNKKLQWKCYKGHIFEKTLSHVYYRKQWCPQCSSRPKITIKDCILEAISRGGKCLSDKYINCETKLLWECKNKHQWSAILRSIRVNDSWCPVCNNYSKQQNKLEKILKCKAKSNYKGFGWLRNPKSGRKLEIDIWFPQLQLAVEYDGEQHFKSKAIFGGLKELEKTKQRDMVKNKLVKQNKDILFFVRFNYREDITERSIINKLKNVGVI